MDVLWKHGDGSSTVRDVADQLPDYAYTTISTVLTRLAEKDLVLVSRQDRVLHYAAAESRAAHTTLLMHEALSAARDPAAALECFVEGATAEHLGALKRALARRRESAISRRAKP